MTRIRRSAAALAAVAVLASCAAGFETRPLAQGFSPGLTEAAPGAVYEAGKVHLAEGRLGLAVQAFRAVLALRPGDVAALNGLGATYDRLQRFDLADRSYMQALTLAPNDPVTLNNVGWSRHLRGQNQLAAVYLRQAVEMVPADPVMRANLAALGASALPEAAGPILEAEAPTVPRLERSTEREVRLVTVAHGTASGRAVSGPVPRVATVAPPAGETRVSRPMPVESATFAGLTVEVSNGNGRSRMASRASAWLGDAGVPVHRLTNAESFAIDRSRVLFRTAAARPAAERLAAMLPGAVAVTAAPGQPSDLRLILGADLAAFDRDVLTKGEDHDPASDRFRPSDIQVAVAHD